MNPAGQAAPPYAPPAYAAMTASQLYAATQLAKEDWSAAITDLRDQASELDRLTGPASAAQLAIVMGSSLNGSAVNAGEMSASIRESNVIMTAMTHHMTRPAESLWANADDHAVLAAGDRAAYDQAVASRRQDEIAASLGGIITDAVNAHVTSLFEHARIEMTDAFAIMNAHHAIMTESIETSATAHGHLEHYLEDGNPDRMPMSAFKMRIIDTYQRNIKRYSIKLQERCDVQAERTRFQGELTALLSKAVRDQAPDHHDVLASTTAVLEDARRRVGEIDTALTNLRRGVNVDATLANQPRVHLEEFDMSAITSVNDNSSDAIIMALMKAFKGREDIYLPVQIVIRSMHDLDPRTGSFWRCKRSDIPEIIWSEGGMKEANSRLYDLIFPHLPATIRSQVGAPVTYGFSRDMVQLKAGDGITLCFILMTLMSPISQAKMDALLADVQQAHIQLRTGNPGTKIRKFLRPTLQRLTELQIPVQGVSTLEPIMRTLAKRDPQFAALHTRASSPYPHHTSSQVCNTVLMQYLAEAEGVATDLETRATCPAKEFWDNNPFLEGAGKPKVPTARNAKTKRSGKGGDSDSDAGSASGDPAKLSKRAKKARNAKLREQGYDPEVLNANQAQASQGQGKWHPNSDPNSKAKSKGKGKGGKGKGKGKGGKGKSKGGSADKHSHGFQCQGADCNFPWKPKGPGHTDRDICVSCIGEATRKSGRYVHKVYKSLATGSTHEPTNVHCRNMELEQTILHQCANMMRQGGLQVPGQGYPQQGAPMGQYQGQPQGQPQGAPQGMYPPHHTAFHATIQGGQAAPQGQQGQPYHMAYPVVNARSAQGMMAQQPQPQAQGSGINPPGNHLSAYPTQGQPPAGTYDERGQFVPQATGQGVLRNEYDFA